jgi:hypothetical protein
MKRLFTLLTVLLLLSVTYTQAQTFPRTAEIKDPAALERGFGAIVAGVDFDGDGLPEIYACNTNMIDGDYELIPRLYKFEWNLTTSTWDSVWGTVAPIEKQNTWPALTSGDLDKDGKPELYWGPVNNFGTDLNPARVLVYEYPGNGNDEMGVSDGFGGFEPNAKTSIVSAPSVNLRPVKFVIADVDNDGTDELIFSDRGSSGLKFGVLSVDDIPDNGGGLETWTLEFSGLNDVNLSALTDIRDFVVVGNYIGLFGAGAGTAKVGLIKYDAGAWVTFPPQSDIAGNNSSFKGSVVVNFSDNSSGVYVANRYSSKVYFIDKPDGVDTLVSYELADFAPYSNWLNGASVGDIDNDGNPDMVFGCYDRADNTAKVPIFRMEYQGGNKTSPSSYITSIIDSAYWDKKGNMDVVVVANVDGDPSDEVLYTQGYSLNNPNDDPMPIIVLDVQFTPVSVEKETDVVPVQFFVDQNYPNPFNPSTQIKFGITEAANIDLRIYDALGREVASLISNQFMGAGSYNVKFDASNLASGTYVYRIIAGANTVSRKMQLLK